MMPEAKPAPKSMAAGAPKPGAGAAPPGPKKVVVEAYSFRRHGVPHIRKAATVFGIVFLLSAALVTVGHMLLQQARPATDAARQKQSATRDRLVQAETERIEIRDFQPKFEQLRARGFVGPENRLALLESISAIQRERKLLPVTFELAPQQIVALDPTQLEAPLELHASTLTVHLGLLHEMDLVNFLADLKTRGFFSVKDCQLVAQDVVQGAAPTARVTADCTLFWLTVDAAAPVAPDAVPEGA